MEWTKELPKENGLYWYKNESDKVTMISIWNISSNHPMVQHLGSDWDSYLDELKGEWQGPITPPV